MTRPHCFVPGNRVRAWGAVLAASCALWGCHEPLAGMDVATRPSGAMAAGSGSATTAPSGNMSSGTGVPLALWYTHDGAEQLYHAAKYADAEALCKEAVATIEKSRGHNASELAEPLNDLATIYMRQARFNDARAAIERAESVLNAANPQQALMLGRLGINKGWRLYSMGETEAAEKVFADSRALLEKTQKATGAGDDSKDLAEIINNQALMLEEISSDKEDIDGMRQSRRMLVQAWQMRRRVTGEESPETAESLNNLGMNMLFNPLQQDDLALALSTLRKSLEVTEKVYGETNPETAMARTNLAMAYMLHHDFDDAENQLKVAMPVTKQFLGDSHPDRAYELTVMGRIYQERSEYDRAERAFLESVAINQKVYGKSHPNVASALGYLENLYKAEGDEAKQLEIQKQVEKIGGKQI